MRPTLHILSGAAGDKVIELNGGTYTIGRGDDMAIRIDSQQVSRRHAELLVEGNLARILDLGSSNGTLRNGKPVTTDELNNGDQIQIGDVTFEFRIGHRDQPIGLAVDPKQKNGRKVFFRTTNKAREADRRTFTPGSPLHLLKLSQQLGKKNRSPKKLPKLRVIFIGLFSLTLVSLTLLAGSAYQNILRQKLMVESGKRAHDLVRYVAEKNRENLRLKNELLLDVASVREVKGVVQATIVNKDGRTLAPTSRLHTMDHDPFVLEALAQTSDQRILPSPLSPNGTRTYVHPIRAYNDQIGVYETLGAAKIVFSPQLAIGPMKEARQLLFLLIAASIALSVGLGWALSRLITSPLEKLGERIQLWRTGQTTDPLPPPFPDWDSLYEAVDRAIEEKER